MRRWTPSDGAETYGGFAALGLLDDEANEIRNRLVEEAAADMGFDDAWRLVVDIEIRRTQREVGEEYKRALRGPPARTLPSTVSAPGPDRTGSGRRSLRR